MTPPSTPLSIIHIMNAFWSTIDAVLIINLDERPDKWENIQQELSKHVPSKLIHRISAIRGTSLKGFNQAPWFTARSQERVHVIAGASGCTLSHKKALQYAQDNNFFRILILEDDAQFRTPLSEDTAEWLAQFLSLEMDKGMLYLGCHERPALGRKISTHTEEQPKDEGTTTNELWQINGALATHAYIVDKPLIDILLQKLPNEDNIWPWIAQHKAVDEWYHVHLSNYAPIYAVYPNIIWQKPSFSDIGKKEIDYTAKVDTPPVKDWGHKFPQKLAWHNRIGWITLFLLAKRKWLNTRLRGFPPFKKKSQQP